MQSRDTPVVTWLRDVDCCNVACTWCTMHDTDTITRKTSILRCTVVSLATACTRRLLPASLCACVEQLPAATFGFRLRDVAAKSTNRDGPILIVIRWETSWEGQQLKFERDETQRRFSCFRTIAHCAADNNGIIDSHEQLYSPYGIATKQKITICIITKYTGTLHMPLHYVLGRRGE